MNTDAEKLSDFKDRHEGETAFLIGNGPSVRIEDLELLSNSVTFCCNRFYLAYDKTPFRPMYTVASDRQMIGDFGEELVKNTDGTIFVALDERPEISGEFIWLPLRHLKPRHLFEDSISNYVLTGGGTLIVAVQIGFFMGITRYYLYGVDHSFKFKINEREQDVFRKAIGDGNHFIQNYRSGKAWCPPNTNQIEEAFGICNEFMRARGGWVKNATRGGRLEVLEREDFDTLPRRHNKRYHWDEETESRQPPEKRKPLR